MTLSAQNFSFSPSEIRVPAGNAVQIQVASAGGMHDFVIDELDVRETLQAGRNFIFTAPRTPGRYAYYCSIGNHRATGMQGTLIVE